MKKSRLLGTLCAAIVMFLSTASSADNCNGKIQEFTMIWNGAGPISMSQFGGLSFSPTSANTGDEVTFTNSNGGVNVFVIISGSVNGESTFHLSCSDPDMNGDDDNDVQVQVSPLRRDCGKNQGNGKGNDASFINDWLLEGFIDDDNAVLDCTPPVVAVAIDIKPGSDPNCFNINGHGVVPVAVLGAEDFDVYEIDLSSLSFSGLEVRMRGNKGPLCSVDYSNDDAYLDLICHFEDDSDMWTVADGEASMTGNLLDGTAIEGTDSICVVP